MSIPDSNYYIRDDYRSRTESTTLEEDPGSYWTQGRLASALEYQYDVYRIAYRIAANRGRNVSILDVGCGPPRKHNLFRVRGARLCLSLVDQPSVAELAKMYLPAAEFFPVDLEISDVQLGKEFDIVICADVIEHLVNPDPCLELIRRHTRKDGVALISTPDRDRLYGSNLLEPGHPCHVREWNQCEFANFLRSRGFNIKRHRILQQKSSAGFRRYLDPLLDYFGVTSSSYSCQLAICDIEP